MKNVLVLMHDDAGQEARFQAALDIVRARDGHLTCLDVAIAPAFVGGYTEMGAAALMMSDERAREADNRTHMEARLKVEGVPYDWIEATGFLTPSVVDRAALADVIVLNRELDALPYPDMRDLVGDVAIKTGKPIVAVPESARRFDAFGTALVAWDGSRQAEAALRAAVPLLQHAGSVIVAEITDGSVAVPAEEAAEYLSRHGIKCEVRRVPANDLPSKMLLDLITVTGAAYLVMGGFGHSRFVEAAFGGVTRRMLKQSPVPLFLAH